MPPKFSLAINVGEDPAPPQSSEGGQRVLREMDSLRMDNDGITVLTSSYNPYMFNAEGMSKGNSDTGQHYKISEKDITIVKRLGAGASSVVFKGFLFRENRFVAVKKINVFERDMRHQMMNDVKALCDARSVPQLVSFCGAYHVPDGGQIAIVLEYVDGGSLADVLKKVVKIPENVLSKMTAKITKGLMLLHKRHMVHRDIKPANILINLEGEPKITDFGISAFMNGTLAVCNTFLGTVTYMSPERLENMQYSFPADIWSLGLSLVEAATGRYPYDVNVGAFELMIQVMNEDVPLINASDFSPEFRDFVRLCLQKDPLKRPSAEQLLEHPFIRKYENDPVSVKEFMQCCFDPQDKLDEIAVVFAWNFYAILSAGAERLKDLAPLYADGSVFTYDGERAVGCDAIIAKLRGVAQLHAGFKIAHEVQQVDCQALGVDGSALVHVQGHLKLGMSGPGNKPTPFTEIFVLSQISPGEYYVASQMFRLFK
ncbi:hypothetical protein CEUSTIGMA_g1021.t1 [Chlamydomonas eustigma]|uniref:mitogen-activated protein kinase kinase n=1 Tax=Chlamydomonas eustigma TaxID=1157962 RepID=A0A250WSR1_9CHLO|nr:hypothetical protein CEUSTIGMA_g1021.t1 [Chlamydomonas eustigma]|eukprot:GAX73570.1 hypothetical protein CEUSTIGMA_g1021.t1 [Chlamydomonas eustigma]